jgi:hypothetical protein
MFPADALHDLPPPHLRQLDRDTTAGIVAGLLRIYGEAMPYGLALEVQAFAESRTVHDAGRIATALRGAYAMPALADMVEASIAEAAP